MEKLSALTPESLGRSDKTHGSSALISSPPASKPTGSEQLDAAKAATERLFKMLPPLRVADPEVFVAGTVDILIHYPPDLMMDAVHAIAVKTNSPTLKFIKDTCDEIWEPIRRKQEREHLASERKRALPPPGEKRTAEEQARAEAQVAAIRKDFAIPEGGIVKPQQAPPVNHDGRHMSRIWVDLEQRKVRNAMRQEQGNEVSDRFDFSHATNQ